MQKTVALTDITKRVHPHLLRHSVATTLLERAFGQNIRTCFLAGRYASTSLTLRLVFRSPLIHTERHYGRQRLEGY
jgi:integrase